MANFQNPPTKIVVPPLKFGVDIPTLGVVHFPQSMMATIKDLTGSSTAQFLSSFSYDAFVLSLLEKSANAREGSAQQNLARSINLMNYRQGCRQTDAPYSDFAKVWEAYCKKRFYRDDTMTTYGKRVSMNIYIGLPEDKNSYRKLPLVFPLHTYPCDICHFLTTIKKIGSRSESPYADLDLAQIHKHFESNIEFKPVEATPAVEDEPCYVPTSPQVVEEFDSDPEPFIPATPVKTREHKTAPRTIPNPRKRNLLPALECELPTSNSVVKIRKLDEMTF
jgi:hypothetical protein